MKRMWWRKLSSLFRRSRLVAMLSLVVLAAFVGVATVDFDQELHLRQRMDHVLSLLGRDPPGTIILSSPQVYTRERLINQRLEDELWLREQYKTLHSSTNLIAGFSSSSTRYDVGNGASPPPAASEGGPPAPARDKAALSFPDELRVRLGIREILGHKILENQLDDRHDLLGNSIYVLKFDMVAISPPETRGRGLIDIELHPPRFVSRTRRSFGTPSSATPFDMSLAGFPDFLSTYLAHQEVVQPWRRLLDQWTADLKTRFNGQISRLQEAIFSGQAPRKVYVDLLNDMLATIPSAALEKAGIETLYQAAALAVCGQNVNTRRCLAGNDAKDVFFQILDTVQKEGLSDRSQGLLFVDLFDRFLVSYTTASILGIDTSEIKFTSPFHQIDTAGAQPSGSSWTITYNATSEERTLFIPRISEILQLRIPRRNDFRAELTFDATARIDTFYLVKKGCARSDDISWVDRFALFGEISEGTDEKTLYYLMGNGDARINSDRLPITSRLPVNARSIGVLRKAKLVAGLDEQIVGLIAPQFAGCGAVEIFSLPAGLLRFMGSVDAAETYSYAVLPRENIRAVAEESVRRSAMHFRLAGGRDPAEAGAAGPEAGGAGRSLAATAEFARAFLGVSSRTLLSSYGELRAKEGSSVLEIPAFGWVVDPSAVPASGPRLEPTTIQESAMAIVSVPAWWDEVELQVRTSWSAELRASTRRAAAGGDERSGRVLVSLPNSLEGIDSVVLDMKRRKPSIRDIEFENDSVCGGREFRLIILGYRLWRNSVVTLGATRARGIVVLPNMEGLIAEFAAIPDLVGDVSLPLRVWTSEGMTQLKRDVAVSYADETRCGRPPPPAETRR